MLSPGPPYFFKQTTLSSLEVFSLSYLRSNLNNGAEFWIVGWEEKEIWSYEVQTASTLVQHALDVVVYIIFCTECACDRQTGEPLHPGQGNRINIKPNNEWRKQSNKGHQWKSSEDALSVLVESAEGEIRQEGKRQQQAAEEAEDVGDVIDPWQEPTDKEEEQHDEQLQKGLPRLLQDLPSLEQLNKQAGEESKLRASWTHLQEENSMGQFGFKERHIYLYRTVEAQAHLQC